MTLFGGSIVLKSLNKYMDNLKSPYWEIYFWIFIIAIAIAGTAIIFIDSEGLASKFGNTGSFLGGLFTIAAVFVAVLAYKASKKSDQESLIFNKKQEIKSDILPGLQGCLELQAWLINSNMETLRDNKNYEFKFKDNVELRVLRDRLEKSNRYLTNLKAVKTTENASYDTLIKLVGDINFYNNLIPKVKDMEESQQNEIIKGIFETDNFKNFIKIDEKSPPKTIFDMENAKVRALISDVNVKYFGN